MPMCLDSDGISTKDTHGTDVFVCDQVENLIYKSAMCSYIKRHKKIITTFYMNQNYNHGPR